MKKFAVTVIAAAMLLSSGSIVASAAEDNGAETGTASYSYTAGQQRSRSRNDIYAQAAAIASEDAREAFLNEQGIGENQWSEEAAASYSYVAGRLRGAAFRTDETNDNTNSDMSSYGYLTGQQRGSSYHKE